MSIFKESILFFFIIVLYSTVNAAIPARSGWWKFDNAASITQSEAGLGSALTLVGSQTATAGPKIGNGATHVGKGSYYKMQHNSLANGGGTKVNEYTLQFDFKVTSITNWHSFFQTNVLNSDDGDFFINTSGKIGVSAVGYSTFSIVPNEWYRLLVSVKNGTSFTYYLDGKLLKTGNMQTVDGRFALEQSLLIFGDDDGEDGSIYCSELAIWNQTLSAAQAKELGGFGHFATYLMTRIPYLQGQTSTATYICWHDTAQIGTKVDYGLDPNSLSLTALGTNELVTDPYRWHTVKLTNLQPNTRYFYKVQSGSEVSPTYSFKTLPDDNYKGKLRFVLLSDTHCPESTAVGKVMRAAKAKITELYGSDIENHVNGIFHSGDITVSGNVIEEYSTQYFRPLSVLSSNIPTMVVAGNHEGESPYFYQYLKLDDQAAFPQNSSLNEKIWQMKVGNSLFIGLNTNISSQYGSAQAAWLDAKLSETEKDDSIDFVFIFFHHLPFSELWNIADAGATYSNYTLLPILKKYSKVQQIHYGHTHGFERGTIQSNVVDGDFRMICGGGGGGNLDPWYSNLNHDYEDVHITYSHNFFQILEIDIANHSFQNAMYSIGSSTYPRNTEQMDLWYKNKNQMRPNTPTVHNVAITNDQIQFNTSIFDGVDSLMTVQFQVLDKDLYNVIVLDSLVHWKNVFGVDAYGMPIDRNINVNLYQSKIDVSKLLMDKSYLFKVRYRDHNLKWSEWSNSIAFTANGISGVRAIKEETSNNCLHQNYPNPFQLSTKITYELPEKSEVQIRIYDLNYCLVDKIEVGIKPKGLFSVLYNAVNLNSGIYFYQMITPKFTTIKKMIKL